MNITASALADYLTRQMSVYGQISRGHAVRLLFLHNARPTREQVEQAIILAIARRQVTCGHGGSTLEAKVCTDD